VAGRPFPCKSHAGIWSKSVCLMKSSGPGDGQENFVHDKWSRKDDGLSSRISDTLPGTASMTRHRQPDGCSQHAPTAARSCCHPSIHETIQRRTVAALICTVLTPRPNAALRNGPSQSSGTKFGTYGGNAEIAQDQLSNTCVSAVAAACCHESIGADCSVPLE